MGTRGDARDPQPGPSSPVAATTLSRAASRAITFATGTLGWELGLEPVPSASPDAPRAPVPALVRLTRNLLDRVLAGPRQPQPERANNGGPQRPRR